jgi:hypothetical protein
MVQGRETGGGGDGAGASGDDKLSIHIYLTKEGHERVVKDAEYAALENIIEGHPRGNMSQWLNYCIELGHQALKQYILKKRGYQ